MSRITRIATALLIVSASAGQAQEPIIGLLAIPELFGSGACEPFEPSEVPLFTMPDGAVPVGAIRVDEYWTFPQAGGCEGLRVRVHMAWLEKTTELPTREYGYEAPAAVVLQQRGRWFEVRLHHGSAWLRATDRAEFFPLERLLLEGLTYSTDAFDGGLADSPGGVIGGVRAEDPRSGRAVKVVDVSRIDDQLWLYVELLSHSPCESLEEPGVVVRGWTQAHHTSGEPTVWFHSRGC